MQKWWIFLLVLIVGCGPNNQQKESKSEQHTQVIESISNVPNLPDSIEFCGKIVHLTDFESQERLHREFIVNTYYHSATLQILLKTRRYFPIIERILKENKLPDDLKYVCVAESALSNVTSPAGAKGFWQFMPETAEEYGLRVDDEVDERMDIERSTKAACDYLLKAYAKFGDWSLAVASYNMGMGGIQYEVNSQRSPNYNELLLNAETSRYVMRIIALKYIIEHPDRYGYQVSENDYYEPIKYRPVTVNQDIDDLVE